MNIYLAIIILALVGEYLLRSIARYLNLKALSPEVPEAFRDVCDEAAYRRSQA